MHAAAHGALGLVSSHDVDARWSHPCFDTSVTLSELATTSSKSNIGLRAARDEHTHQRNRPFALPLHCSTPWFIV